MSSLERPRLHLLLQVRALSVARLGRVAVPCTVSSLAGGFVLFFSGLLRGFLHRLHLCFQLLNVLLSKLLLLLELLLQLLELLGDLAARVIGVVLLHCAPVVLLFAFFLRGEDHAKLKMTATGLARPRIALPSGVALAA